MRGGILLIVVDNVELKDAVIRLRRETQEKEKLYGGFDAFILNRTKFIMNRSHTI